jgi:hypothetical protein
VREEIARAKYVEDGQAASIRGIMDTIDKQMKALYAPAAQTAESE